MNEQNDLRELSTQNGDFSNLFARLAADKKPPERIFALGDFTDELFAQPSVAIVGSRKATDYGREITLKFARKLAERGVVIVSGLAIGVDSFAARGALDANGRTIAVLGNGLPKIYPAQNRELAEKILANSGAILSEYEPDASTFRQNFLERNRLISALADIVIVVEANLKSGSLSTAAHAKKQGKIIMAVPGNIDSPLSDGTNSLIADGAAPALNAKSIIEKLREFYKQRFADGEIDDEQYARVKAVLAPNAAKTSQHKFSAEDGEQAVILNILKNGAASSDEILAATALSSEDFSVAITMLELGGAVKNAGDKWMLA